MTSSRSWLVSGVALLVGALAAAPASAQDGRLGLHVNFGAQTGSGDISQQLRPMIYDETAVIDINQTYESGPLVDVGGDYFLFRRSGVLGHVGVGVSYSHTSGDGNATLAGQIPDPLYADTPRSVVASASSLKHTENAVHLDVLYRFAATPKLGVTVGIGPTFFSMKQDLMTSVDITEVSTAPPFAPPNTTAVVKRLSDTPAGVNVSGDVTYKVTRHIGAGLLLRFAKSTGKLQPSEATGPIKVRAGGFQVAVGVRARF